MVPQPLMQLGPPVYADAGTLRARNHLYKICHCQSEGGRRSSGQSAPKKVRRPHRTHRRTAFARQANSNKDTACLLSAGRNCGRLRRFLPAAAI